MRSPDSTRARSRRRCLGLLVGLLAIAGGLAGCSDHDEPGTPAISGGSPGEVTVPTLPPTTTEATDDAGVGSGGAESSEGEAPAETTVPAVSADGSGPGSDEG